MATTPVFCASLAALQAQMRLSTLTESDALEVFKGEVRAARVRLYSTLGKDRVDAILATALTDTPETDAAIVRLAAADLEGKIVLLNLRRRLPSSFRDASATSLRTWNEAPEAPGRDPFDVENRRLEADIEALFDTVSGESDVGDAVTVRVDNVEPDEIPAALGSARWPSGEYVP